MLYCATLLNTARQRSERSERASLAIRIRIRSKAHLSAVERQLNKCTLHADNGATLCHTTKVVEARDTMSPKIKLKDVTFVLGDKPMRNLLWCDKLGKGKRHKAAKINGVLVGEPTVFHEL